MSSIAWRPDILDGFSCTDLPLPVELLDPTETSTSIGAVLVRRDRARPVPDWAAPPQGPIQEASGGWSTGEGPTAGTSRRPAVLYVHGWSDYFFQKHLGDFWAGLGHDFYAVDLRRYGRALRQGQLLGYITDLADYSREIDAAVAVMHADGHDELVLMAHSTGGLTGALYADTHPGVFSAVVLNSPWLALSGNTVLSQMVSLLVAGAGKMAPTAVIRMSDPGFYRRSVLKAEGGEWNFDPSWKSSPQAQIRLGWGRAIVRGHERVAAGLHIDAPVLVLCSQRSYAGTTWAEEMTRADIVLDASAIAHRAVDLGRLVTVARITDGLHDLALSPEPVRREFFRTVGTWVASYCGL
ncbi:Lysophospholipase, alpha-beta hydrolase superfamily [Raineyella antarctica]|uniref:Lysophospholipase, alpha-beta hydrolase superfamily n=1 Tax=Raineyella antarctica TaxID=1577474 RepID=A0A1G6GCW3_9ACTN|nr:alpha/beta hydrolase [Raineyella antarctica]SDB79842.1 Lysophospholipase, alpha-beta hydrolase superfamily [Raineyella antarctica]